MLFWMSLFKKSTEAELRNDIAALKKGRDADNKRRELLETRSELERKRRQLKYGPALERAKSAGGFLARVGSGALSVGSKTVSYVEKRKVPQPFKTAFPTGRMVGVPRNLSGPVLPAQKARDRPSIARLNNPSPRVSSPTFNSAAVNAFQVKIRAPK